MKKESFRDLPPKTGRTSRMKWIEESKNDSRATLLFVYDEKREFLAKGLVGHSVFHYCESKSKSVPWILP